MRFEEWRQALGGGAVMLNAAYLDTKFHNHRFREFPRGLRAAAAKMSAGAPAAAQPPSGKTIFVSPVPNLSSAWNEKARIAGARSGLNVEPRSWAVRLLR